MALEGSAESSTQAVSILEISALKVSFILLDFGETALVSLNKVNTEYCYKRNNTSLRWRKEAALW